MTSRGFLGRVYRIAIRPFRRLVGSAGRGLVRQRAESMIRWAGRLIVAYGSAHTLGALTVEGAGRHAGSWFNGGLWGEDLANMSPAGSAYWLSVMSFGPPLVLLGLTVLWLERRGITPPPFLAWALGVWTLVDSVVAGPGAAQNLILLVAIGLLLAGVKAHRPAGAHPHRADEAGVLRP